MFYHFGSKKLRKVKCKSCGKMFTTYHPSQSTCSVECSMARKTVAAKELNKNNKIYYSKARKSK